MMSADAQPWELHYCARSSAHAAFYDEISQLPHGWVAPHFSEVPTLDVADLLRDVPPGMHV